MPTMNGSGRGSNRDVAPTYRDQPLESIVSDRSSLKLITALSLQLRRGQLAGPENVSEATAKLLRSVVSSAKYTSMQHLIDIIKASGKYLQNAQPQEQSIGNVTRRVVHLLREEAKAALLEAQEKVYGSGAASSPADHSGINSLTSSISDLRVAATFESNYARLGSHEPAPTSASGAGAGVTRSGVGSSHLHKSGVSSPTSTAPTHFPPSPLSVRPGPYPLRSGSASEGFSSSSAFVRGNFSISDLVAAGAMATSTSSSMAHTPAEGGSYTSTPHASLSRKGSDILDSNLLLSQVQQTHQQQQQQQQQHLAGLSLTEDVDGEAEAEQKDMDSEDSTLDSDGASQSTTSDNEDADASGATTRSTNLRPSSDRYGKSDSGKKDSNNGGGGPYFLKPLLIQAIQDLIDELETVNENIARVSRDHIHSGEVILTLGTTSESASTVSTFFTAAARSDRRFTVIVAETAPGCAGHELARRLARVSGISVLLIPDSSIYAVMPRVSKVVLGAHAVLANGGLLSNPGSLPTALAAKEHATPVVILTGTYKICPEWSNIQTFSNSYGDGPAPQALFGLADSTTIVQNAEIVSNAFDYIPPHLVHVFITNLGEHPPSYVYRLVKENYHQDDLVL